MIDIHYTKCLCNVRHKLCCPQTFPGSASAASEEANINIIDGGGGGAWSEEQDFPGLISSICPNLRLVTIL